VNSLDLTDSRKPFSPSTDKQSQARLAIVRPKLLQYIKQFDSDALLIVQGNFKADLRLILDGGFVDIEDEVRTGEGICQPGKLTLSVPNRPNKLAYAKLYCQYHQETDLFWIASTEVVRAWEPKSTIASNHGDLEKFLRGPSDSVDWYRVTESGVEVVDDRHGFLKAELNSVHGPVRRVHVQCN
jgi:hypothetical protein